MQIHSQKLRSARKIVTGSKYKEILNHNSLTVYLGIFNGTPYLASLLQQIQNQTLKNFPLIVVDNASTDDSWNEILSWPDQVTSRAKLIRNPINLGGTGGFALNADHVETEWFVTIHQDDSYGPNHVEVINRAILASDLEDLVIFSDMGTQNMKGKKLFTPIRQSWVANLETPQSRFRSNLVQQSVSYPSAAFRTNGIVPLRFAWHSSSFPDTEITLLQSSRGSFRFVPELTMLYRMNPKSESHDLNPKERVLGPFASLSRVMASDSFLSLCLSVPEQERDSFSNSVLEGIDIRLGASPFSEIVKLIAAETMGLAWDYSEKTSREQIWSTYKLAEDGRTTKLLEELGAFFDEGASPPPRDKSQNLSSAQIDLEQLLREATPPSNAQASGIQRFLLTLVGQFFPLTLRRKVISFVVHLYTRFNSTSPWNLSWKPKS